MKTHDSIYREEDATAEKEIGARFAEAWGLSYLHFGGMCNFDGLLVSAPPDVRYIFELKNRNVKCDGYYVWPTGAPVGYTTLPLSKAKVESLYAESVRRGVPALLVFHAKVGGTVWWVDISRCLTLPVHHNSGRTLNPLRPSDIEDCVYIPIEWFRAMEIKP